MADVQEFANSWLVYEESQSCFNKEQACTQLIAVQCEIILSDVFKVGCFNCLVNYNVSQ